MLVLMNRLLFIAAMLALLGVGAGTFGAHGLTDYLSARVSPERSAALQTSYETGARYHMYHALALLALAVADLRWRRRSVFVAAGLFIAGIVIFSGSLYLLALTNLSWLGAITPIGGLCFFGGWVALMFAACRRPSQPVR